MNEKNIETIVKHCYKYPSNNCHGYILETEKAVAVSHTPFLPPFTTIYHEDITKKHQIKAMYYSTTEKTLPSFITSFCEKHEINTIYLINLYHQSEKFVQYVCTSHKQWEVKDKPSFSLSKINVNSGDVIEFESIYDRSL